MVAFGFLPQNFRRWLGPTNGTLSFYEIPLMPFCTEVVGSENNVLVRSNPCTPGGVVGTIEGGWCVLPNFL